MELISTISSFYVAYTINSTIISSDLFVLHFLHIPINIKR